MSDPYIPGLYYPLSSSLPVAGCPTKRVFTDTQEPNDADTLHSAVRGPKRQNVGQGKAGLPTGHRSTPVILVPAVESVKKNLRKPTRVQGAGSKSISTSNSRINSDTPAKGDASEMPTKTKPSRPWLGGQSSSMGAFKLTADDPWQDLVFQMSISELPQKKIMADMKLPEQEGIRENLPRPPDGLLSLTEDMTTDPSINTMFARTRIRSHSSRSEHATDIASKITQLKNALEAKEKKIAALRKDKEALERERTVLEEDGRELRADMNTATALASTLEEENRKAKEDLATVSAEAGKLYKEVADLKFAIARQRERNASLEEAHAKTIKENATLREDRAKTIRENAEIMLLIAKIYGENAEYQRERLARSQGDADHAIKVEEDEL